MSTVYFSFQVTSGRTVNIPGNCQMLLKVRTSGENVFLTSGDVKGNGLKYLNSAVISVEEDPIEIE